MSEWKKVKLGDLATKITKGTTPSNIGESFCDRGIPFIRSELITQNKYISDSGLLYISKETHEKLKRSQLEANDILFSMAGVYLGKTAILRECDVPANTNQAVALIRLDPVLCNVGYIYYYLNQDSVIRYVNQISGQAAQPNINLQQIGEIPIAIPSRKEQDTIATILSRYDTLIENYQKQIKLLEESAQRLYKEWFVDLRFPGYENAKMVDGLPEGWERKKLGELVEFKRGKTITKKEAIEGNIPVVAGGLEPAYYCDKSNTTDRVITISGSGANAGFTRMYFEKVWASDCSFADTSATQYLHFVFCFLRENKTVIDNMQKGAAQPHVYAKDINSLEALLPTKEILNSFEIKASKIFDNIASLQTQIRLLTEARDRLLPRLMGGEMEVKEQM